MLLRDLQSLLERIYGIDVPQDIYDFLTTDEQFARHLDRQAQENDPGEKLYVVQDDSGLNVALYLNADVLDRLLEADPREYLDQSNLADFCTVLEGISHFNYLLWNAGFDKSVTLMELELQAEIDKYIGVRHLLRNQPESDLNKRVFPHLFENFHYDSHLTKEEIERYSSANSFAGRFCRNLETRYSGTGLSHRMLSELRAFYRWPQPDKLSHIRSAQFG